MDMQKIGRFLKQLRKEKGMSQEQLAERLNVSARTVSRWETAVTMPDLSILMELADFYNIELKEILDGERKGEEMDQEMKETLTKAADYSRAEKERVEKTALTAFGLTFFTCVIVCVLQLLLFLKLELILGELITWAVGGVGFLVLTARNGLWEEFSGNQKTNTDHARISLLMSAVFTALCSAMIYRLTKQAGLIAVFAVCCFGGLFLLGYAVIRALEKWSEKRKNQGG